MEPVPPLLLGVVFGVIFLAAAIRRALSPERRARPASVGEMRAELKAAVEPHG